MSLAVPLVLALGAALAYANGGNDVSKGIATLAGSGVTNYRRAIAWGAAWTAAGGVLAALYARAMLRTFGEGLLASGTTPSLTGALSVIVGAAGWVLLATRVGLPVSTTHAIVGSLVGVMGVAYSADAVMWSALGGKVLLPLLASPFASLVLTGLVLRATRPPPLGGPVPADCLCVGVGDALAPVAVNAFALDASPQLTVTAGPADACATDRPVSLRLTLDHLHWLTSGATSLARGMNDAPKIVALLLACSVLLEGVTVPAGAFFALVTMAMAGGSLIAGRRVTHLLAERVTPMSHREGFAANLVTAGLVTAGAVYGLPMSTTHVASAGIVSAGYLRGTLDRKTVRDVLLAWVVTLPAAAALGMASFMVMDWVRG